MRDCLFRKGLVVGIIVLFIGAGIASPAQLKNDNISKNHQLPSIPLTNGKTIYVDDDNTEGPWDGTLEHPYQYIRDALDNSTDGDTIFVFSGYYYEGVGIHNQIKLIGEDKYTTIIEGEKRHHAVILFEDYITISGFTINNTDEWPNDSGIEIQKTSMHNTITGNIFTNHGKKAIHVDASDNHIITYNIVKSGGISTGSYCRHTNISNNTFIDCGIHVWGAPQHNLISNNHITNGGILVRRGFSNIVRDNVIEDGGDIKISWETTDNVVENNVLKSSGSIILDESSNTVVRSNTFIGSKGIYLAEGKIEYWNTHTIEDNIVQGKPVYYYKNIDGITVPSDLGQVIFANCKNCLIENLNVKDVYCGIQIGFSTANTITDCSIYNITSSGIRIHSSSYNIIENNIINNVGVGIDIGGDSFNNDISKNKFIFSQSGILIRKGCYLNDIRNNFIKNNEEYGVFLSGFENTIYGNNFENNGVGVFLDYSYDNKIWNNNFIKNNRYGTFELDYKKERSNEWKSNYYGFTFGFFPKLIWGRVRTRFYFEFPDGTRSYFFRRGLNFDWHPAKEPYDI